ncbi:MAG: hypothetical protein LGB01_04995 [Sulfurovum sp.]|nr:hypothetical protein [Sulfurovum sp.]
MTDRRDGSKPISRPKKNLPCGSEVLDEGTLIMSNLDCPDRVELHHTLC